MDVVLVKNSSDKELYHLYHAATQHYEVPKAAKNNSFEMVLTVILQQKLNEKTQLTWVKIFCGSENVYVSLYTEFL